MSGSRKFYRSRDSVWAGVCAGMAESLDLNPWGMRLIWVLVTLFTGPLTVIAYFVIAMAVERRPEPPPLAAAAGGRPFVSFDRMSRTETLNLLAARFAKLEKRLQRMESVVTRPAFELEKRCRDM